MPLLFFFSGFSLRAFQPYRLSQMHFDLRHFQFSLFHLITTPYFSRRLSRSLFFISLFLSYFFFAS